MKRPICPLCETEMNVHKGRPLDGIYYWDFQCFSCKIELVHRFRKNAKIEDAWRIDFWKTQEKLGSFPLDECLRLLKLRAFS